jgi:hypothetical protein
LSSMRRECVSKEDRANVERYGTKKQLRVYDDQSSRMRQVIYC